MNTFTVKHLPDYLSILMTVTAEYRPHLHLPSAVEQMIPILDASPARMWVILEFTNIKLTMDDFLHATDDSIRGQGERIVKHPNCKTAIVISPNKLWHATARGMRSPAFGKLSVYAYDTLDQALAAIRERLPVVIDKAA